MTLQGFSAAGLSIHAPMVDDIPSLMEMIAELAMFLKVPQNFYNTPENLERALLGEAPRLEAIVATFNDDPAGFATWGLDYRLFSGKQAMQLDYIYVKPEFRGKPVAIAMLVYLLSLAKRRDYLYIHGAVLNSNQGALNLYAGLKMKELDARAFKLDLEDVDWSLFQRFCPARSRQN